MPPNCPIIKPQFFNFFCYPPVAVIMCLLSCLYLLNECVPFLWGISVCTLSLDRSSFSLCVWLWQPWMPSGLASWPRRLWRTCTWLSRLGGLARTLGSHPTAKPIPNSVKKIPSTSSWATAWGFTTSSHLSVTSAALFAMATAFITWQRTLRPFDF